MKSKELKIYNLPYETGYISQINARPTMLIIGLIICGVILLFLDVSKVYGTTIIVSCVACICFVPKTTLMEFYENYFVIFNKVDRESCYIAYYDEVASWHYSWSARKDYLIVEFTDGSIEKVEAFSKTLFESNMNRFLKEKHKKTK